MATRKGIYQKLTIEEEEDLELIKNHFLNPLLDTDTILLEFLNLEDEVWINTKTNVATSLVVKANSKKPELSPEQFLKNITNTWTFLTKIKQIDIWKQDPGIIRSK